MNRAAGVLAAPRGRLFAVMAFPVSPGEIVEISALVARAPSPARPGGPQRLTSEPTSLFAGRRAPPTSPRLGEKIRPQVSGVAEALPAKREASPPNLQTIFVSRANFCRNVRRWRPIPSHRRPRAAPLVAGRWRCDGNRPASFMRRGGPTAMAAWEQLPRCRQTLFRELVRVCCLSTRSPHPPPTKQPERRTASRRLRWFDGPPSSSNEAHKPA